MLDCVILEIIITYAFVKSLLLFIHTGRNQFGVYVARGSGLYTFLVRPVSTLGKELSLMTNNIPLSYAFLVGQIVTPIFDLVANHDYLP